MNHYRRSQATPVRTALRLLGLAVSFVGAAHGPVRASAPVELPAAPATPAPEPTDLYTADDMPSVEAIEAAAADYNTAAELARRADRGKRAARKILDRLPAGPYGAWQVERVPNAREVADLEAIRAIFKANGLGPVPMKDCAASLKVTRVEAVPAAEHAAELLAA